jgi:hypothetical protein
METPSFPLGQCVITANAERTLHPADVRSALDRHARGDWGELCPHDWAENEAALQHGARLFSRYSDRTKQVTFYIITEHDRSVTTVLLPEDY